MDDFYVIHPCAIVSYVLFCTNFDGKIFMDTDGRKIDRWSIPNKFFCN